jgi:hypothetical protein
MENVSVVVSVGARWKPLDAGGVSQKHRLFAGLHVDPGAHGQFPVAPDVTCTKPSLSQLLTSVNVRDVAAADAWAHASANAIHFI